ncbi:hypothetical protein GN244_ATG18236 [Phytophthora infestans]|uniref:Uncharacterized protein n=1 Tax=Phytophthora infestans TaxID=4787 RepID=A0A833WKA4_PHYIN|nr:hypothetical protein GN244_ATG18236 [Phytophthora infestans]KAF4148706.1 hypothetical protein GN958_ATG02103 [Phytophthora infestans]
MAEITKLKTVATSIAEALVSVEKCAAFEIVAGQLRQARRPIPRWPSQQNLGMTDVVRKWRLL